MKKSANNVFESQIEEIFNRKVPDLELLLCCASMIIFSNPRNESIGKVYKKLGIENFSKVVDTFAGKTITFPTMQELEEILILTTCYYYREVENYEWAEIKELLPFQINPVLYGHKIGGLNKQIRSQLSKKFEKNSPENRDFIEAIIEFTKALQIRVENEISN